MNHHKGVSVFLAPKEYEHLCSLSRKTKLSKSAVMRHALNGAKFLEPPPIDYFDLIKEIRSVGNNISELLKTERTTGIIDEDKLDKALEDLRDAEKNIRNKFNFNFKEE